MREDAAQCYKNQGLHNQELLRRMALQVLKGEERYLDEGGVQAKRKRGDVGYLAHALCIRG